MIPLEGIVQKSLDNKNPEDTYDSEGFLICAVCGERKEGDVDLYRIGKRRVGRACACERAILEREREADRRERYWQRMERLWEWGVADRPDIHNTFASDDGHNPDITQFCKAYVENYEAMLENNIGVLFTGNVGVGKTFYTHSIANGLMDKCVPVCLVSLPKLLNCLQGYNVDKQEIIDIITSYAFLVIDDFGVERNTSYASEQIYNLINSRCLSRKPTIISSNLTKEELKNPPSMEHARIYSRVSEMCPKIKMVGGVSRRPEMAKKRREQIERVLENDNQRT